MNQRIKIGILLAVVLIVYGNSLLNSFVMDDELYIFRNPQVTAPSIPGFFHANAATNVYRPFTFATFAANLQLNRDRPLGYHLFNLALHAAATLLLFFALRTAMDVNPRADTIAFVAALLFAVLPIHTEAVDWIVGRSELLAAAFIFAGWWLHLRNRPIFAVLCFALALLSKESAVAFLPIVVAGDYARGKMKRWPVYAALAATVLLYLLALRAAQGSHFGPADISMLDNPLSLLPVKWRILNAIRIAWKYVGLQIYPATLSCDYSFDEIRLYADLRHTIPWLLATLGVFAAWCWSVWKRKAGYIIAGAIYFAGFAATANILTVTGTIMGERLAYLPSAGFCLLLALLWSSIEAKQRNAAIALLAVAAATFGVRAVVRNLDWKNNLTLYESGVRAVPGSAKMHSYLGGAYLLNKQFDLARKEFQTALQIYPQFPDTIESLGLLESWTGNRAEALRLMETALRMSDRKNINYDYILVNLAAIQMESGRSEDALQLLNREIAEAPGYSRAWSNRAVIHLQRGEISAARSDAESALRLDPANGQAIGVLNKLATPSAAPAWR